MCPQIHHRRQASRPPPRRWIHSPDELNRRLGLLLEIRRQRPVAVAHTAAIAVQKRIQREGEIVGTVADDGEPLGELITPSNSSRAGSESACRRASRGHAAGGSRYGRNSFRDTTGTSHRGCRMYTSCSRAFRAVLQNIVVRLFPIPRTPHPPKIDNVPNQIKVLDSVCFRKSSRYSALHPLVPR